MAFYSQQDRDHCQKWLEDHRVPQLFNKMCAELVCKRPENPREFLITFLDDHKKRVEDKEGWLKSVFANEDGLKKNSISGQQAKKAFEQLVESTSQAEALKAQEFGVEVTPDAFVEMGLKILC